MLPTRFALGLIIVSVFCTNCKKKDLQILSEKPVLKPKVYKKCQLSLVTYNVQNGFDCVAKNNDARTPLDFQESSNWYEERAREVNVQKSENSAELGVSKKEMQRTPACSLKAALLAEVINNHLNEPTFVGLQEIESARNKGEFLNELNNQLKKPFNAIATGMQTSSNPVLHTQGFMSRSKILFDSNLRYDSVKFPGAARDPHVTQVKVAQNIVFINSHWKSLAFDSHEGSHMNSQEAHLEIVTLISQYISERSKANPKLQFIVFGDFNVENKTERVQMLANSVQPPLKSVWDLGKAIVTGTTTAGEGNNRRFVSSDNILISESFLNGQGEFKFESGPDVFGPREKGMFQLPEYFPKKWKIDHSGGRNIHRPEASGPSDHFPIGFKFSGPCLQDE